MRSGLLSISLNLARVERHITDGRHQRFRIRNHQLVAMIIARPLRRSPADATQVHTGLRRGVSPVALTVRSAELVLYHLQRSLLGSALSVDGGYVSGAKCPFTRKHTKNFSTTAPRSPMTEH